VLQVLSFDSLTAKCILGKNEFGVQFPVEAPGLKMANEYAQARKKRQEGGGRIVIETPGVNDETEKKPKITFGKIQRPDETRSEEIKNRGGAYSDRIKIEPKFGMEERKTPLPSDTEIQKQISGQVSTT
jgi:hypothetical protein